MHCLADNHEDSYCKVLLLDDTELVTEVKNSAKGDFLLNWVFDKLNLHERDYFGLRYLDHTSQTQWLDPTKTIKSQIKIGAPYTVYFGVKFYAADPCLLKAELTRYQFFLQVKRDILQGRLPVTFDQAAELSAYAVQSELGDYDTRRHSPGYLSEFRFVPNQTSELLDRIHKIHKTLAGQVPSVAERNFCETVKWMEAYGVDFHSVLGEGSIEYFLGLTPTGVVVYKNKSKVGNYFWPRIIKVTFKNKSFMIRVKDKNNLENTYTFECSTKQACKHLWKCCVEHHAFFRLSHVSQPSVNLFHLGSKYRYSGRTEKQAMSELNRPESQVLRTPSRRQQRLSDSSASGTMSLYSYRGSESSVPISKIITPEPVNTPSKSRTESPHSNRTAPWENESQSTGGLYTKGHDSPYSNHSENIMFPRRVPSTGSESERTENVYKKHRSRKEGDENEAPRRRRRRSKDSNKSNKSNNSDQSRKSKSSNASSKNSRGSSSRKHRRHRKRLSKGEEMVDSETQWKEVQRKQVDNENEGLQDALVKDLRPQNGSVRSLQSNDSKDSRDYRKQRRRRSRSPGKRPPAELKQHFNYELVDPDKLSEEQRRDIPYVAVETKAEPFKIKYSPHTRQRRRNSPHSRKPSGPGEGMESMRPAAGRGTTPTSPDAPPPYSLENRLSYNSDVYDGGRKDEVETLVRPSAPTVNKQEMHTAPIVRTKPIIPHNKHREQLMSSSDNKLIKSGYHANLLNLTSEKKNPTSNREGNNFEKPADNASKQISHVRQFGDSTNRPNNLPVRSYRTQNINGKVDVAATFYNVDRETKSASKSRSASPPDNTIHCSPSQSVIPQQSVKQKLPASSPPSLPTTYVIRGPSSPISSGIATHRPISTSISPSRAFQYLPEDLNYGLKLAPNSDVATEL